MYPPSDVPKWSLSGLPTQNKSLGVMNGGYTPGRWVHFPMGFFVYISSISPESFRFNCLYVVTVRMRLRCDGKVIRWSSHHLEGFLRSWSCTSLTCGRTS